MNKGIKIEINDERNEEGRSDEYFYEGGIRSYVEMLNENKEVLYPEPIYIHASRDVVEVEIALQYNTGYATNLLSYANNIHTYEGGTHEEGFRRALTRIINNYGSKNKLIKDSDEKLTGEDVREGLVAVVSIKHEDRSSKVRPRRNSVTLKCVSLRIHCLRNILNVSYTKTLK